MMLHLSPKTIQNRKKRWCFKQTEVQVFALRLLVDSGFPAFSVNSLITVHKQQLYSICLKTGNSRAVIKAFRYSRQTLRRCFYFGSLFSVSTSVW